MSELIAGTDHEGIESEFRVQSYGRFQIAGLVAVVAWPTQAVNHPR